LITDIYVFGLPLIVASETNEKKRCYIYCTYERESDII
jgi:hypothetical protein